MRESYKEMNTITITNKYDRIIIEKGDKACIKEIGIIGLNKELRCCEIVFIPVVK